jgi:hypothetical protein
VPDQRAERILPAQIHAAGSVACDHYPACARHDETREYLSSGPLGIDPTGAPYQPQRPSNYPPRHRLSDEEDEEGESGGERRDEDYIEEE